jgi:hypothetical protein
VRVSTLLIAPEHQTIYYSIGDPPGGLIAVVRGGETVMVLKPQTKQSERNEDALRYIVLPSVVTTPRR